MNRRITLAISLALHALLILLLTRMRFDAPMPTMRVVRVVPVKPVALPPLPQTKPLQAPPQAKPTPPPPAGQAQPAPQPPVEPAPQPPAEKAKPAPPPPEPEGPRAIVVRPFVEKGGDKGEGRGEPEGEENATGTEIRQPAPLRPQPVEPLPPPATEAPASKKLFIDIDAINRRLRELAAAERNQALPFASGKEPQSVPFGTPRGLDGEMGDGTNSTAIGGSAYFDARGYDITPWARRVVYGVKKNWIFPPATQYGLQGVVGVYLVVERDGRVSVLAVRKSSGIRPFDQAAANAVTLASPFPPLPGDFPNANLPAYFVFRYN